MSEKQKYESAELDRISTNPRIGDKVRNPKAAKHPTRTVSDRNIGGDVHYCWDGRSRYFSRCTLDEWKIFCTRSKVINVSKLNQTN